MKSGRIRLLMVCTVLFAACAHTEPASVPPADILYNEAVRTSQPGSFLWWEIDHCDDAIPLFQRVIDNYPFSHYAVDSQLGIAGCYFEQEAWSDTIFYYREFEKLHPNHEKIWMVRYRLGEAYHEQSLAYDLDTIDIEQAHYYYFKTAEGDSPYRAEALRKGREESKQLARRLFYIGRFYERNDESLAAIERYRSLIQSFPDLPHAKRAYLRAAELYRKIGDPEKIASLPRPYGAIPSEEGDE